jgi:hypothetical protein
MGTAGALNATNGYKKTSQQGRLVIGAANHSVD